MCFLFGLTAIAATCFNLYLYAISQDHKLAMFLQISKIPAAPFIKAARMKVFLFSISKSPATAYQIDSAHSG